jgi:hypothetical protein
MTSGQLDGIMSHSAALGRYEDTLSAATADPVGQRALNNLILFMDLADGVDDDTWEFHRRKGEISQWLRQGIKDEPLAAQVAAVERNQQLDAGASRRKMRELIEATYTLPAGS